MILIVQLSIIVAQVERINRIALVVCPLKSIVDYQIAEARSLGISAVSLADVSEEELKALDFELLFGPAENVLEKRFMKIFKDSTTLLNQSLAAVVVIRNF